MKEITSQQQRVLDCIQIYLNKTGFPPTRADICRELGFKSPNSAETHLRALEKKGFISIESGASRGISIIGNSDLSSNMDNNYPVIGLVAAGSPTLAEENIENKISCPDDFFSSSFDYFLKVKGLSMKDAGIMEDDLVAVKKTHDVKNGDIVKDFFSKFVCKLLLAAFSLKSSGNSAGNFCNNVFFHHAACSAHAWFFVILVVTKFRLIHIECGFVT